MDEELLRVLDARGERWQRRLELARGRGATLITVTLCLPVAYRCDPALEALLLALCRRLRAMLRANGIHYRQEGMLRGADGPAVFLTASAPAARALQAISSSVPRTAMGRGAFSPETTAAGVCKGRPASTSCRARSSSRERPIKNTSVPPDRRAKSSSSSGSPSGASAVWAVTA